MAAPLSTRILAVSLLAAFLSCDRSPSGGPTKGTRAATANDDEVHAAIARANGEDVAQELDRAHRTLRWDKGAYERETKTLRNMIVDAVGADGTLEQYVAQKQKGKEADQRMEEINAKIDVDLEAASKKLREEYRPKLEALHNQSFDQNPNHLNDESALDGELHEKIRRLEEQANQKRRDAYSRLKPG